MVPGVPCGGHSGHRDQLVGDSLKGGEDRDNPSPASAGAAENAQDMFDAGWGAD
jgi:hypothetical protein